MIGPVPEFCKSCYHRFNCPSNSPNNDTDAWDMVVDHGYRIPFRSKLTDEETSKCLCMEWDYAEGGKKVQYDQHFATNHMVFRDMIYKKKFVELYRKKYKI